MSMGRHVEERKSGKSLDELATFCRRTLRNSQKKEFYMCVVEMRVGIDVQLKGSKTDTEELSIPNR